MTEATAAGGPRDLPRRVLFILVVAELLLGVFGCFVLTHEPPEDLHRPSACEREGGIYHFGKGGAYACLRVGPGEVAVR